MTNRAFEIIPMGSSGTDTDRRTRTILSLREVPYVHARSVPVCDRCVVLYGRIPYVPIEARVTRAPYGMWR